MKKFLETVVVVGIVMVFGAAVSAQRGNLTTPPAEKPTKPCKLTATKPC